MNIVWFETNFGDWCHRRICCQYPFYFSFYS